MLTVSRSKRRTRKQMLINSYPYLVLFTFVACLLHHALFPPWSHREAVPRESENSDGAHLEDAGVL